MKSASLVLLLMIVSLHAAPSTHVVVKDDTLHRIGRLHGCTVAAIKETNGLQGDLIRIGQILKLPVAPSRGAPVDFAPETVPDPVPSPLTAPITLAAQIKALAVVDRLTVQLFLDQELFAPGKVDGLMGEFTTKAAERWIAAKVGRDIHALVAESRQKFAAAELAFTIPETAADHVGVVPEKLEEKAAAKTLPYETLAEYTAERYHTDLSTLRRLNAAVDLATLKIGDTLKVPAVTPFLIETWPQAGLSARKAHEGLYLHICHDARMIEVIHSDGTLRAAFTGLSEYSMGRFTMTVTLAHSSNPRSTSPPAR